MGAEVEQMTSSTARPEFVQRQRWPAANQYCLHGSTYTAFVLCVTRVLAPAFTGPGKTLHEIYSTLGDRAEKHANRAAHSLGLGPAAVAERIRIFLGNGSQREAALSELRDGVPGKLEKDCRRLVQYALPYPGTRRIFLDCESLKNAVVQENDIALLWNRPGDVDEDQLHFHRKFAAACVADAEISSMVEDIPPQSLGSVLDQCAGLSIVERLLIASDCEGCSTFSRFIAIRYLGGILDLPSFWLQSGIMHRAVVQKILVRTSLLLKDLGVDSRHSDEATPGVLSDTEGVDILCEILLARIQTWLLHGSSSAITHETWYPSLFHFVQLLRQPETENLLPRAWEIATAAELRELVPSHYETRVADVLSDTGQFERVTTDQVNSLSHEQRDPPQEDTHKNLVLYGTVAWALLKDVSNASERPYLQAIAILSLLIMETVRANYSWSSRPFPLSWVKDSETACVVMTERACELVCAIINACIGSEVEMSPAMVRSVAQLSETLEKVLELVREQVKGEYWLRELRSEEDARLITKYNAGFKHALDVLGTLPLTVPSRTLAKVLTFVQDQLKGGFWPRVLQSEGDADFITGFIAGLKDALHELNILGLQSVSNQPSAQTIASVSFRITQTVRTYSPIVSSISLENEEACLKITGRTYELVCAVIDICSDSRAELASAMLRSTVQFSRTLEAIVALMRGQVKGSLWRRVFPVMKDVDLIPKCNAHLKYALEVFRAESISAATEMQKSEALSFLHIRPEYRDEYKEGRRSDKLGFRNSVFVGSPGAYRFGSAGAGGGAGCLVNRRRREDKRSFLVSLCYVMMLVRRSKEGGGK
ncbi:hypothetical protein C8R44DRAFT_923364 [Mycena epipterygia]|nr:hypothetical protein C8R44DRAFT_923364 [Mycena epipterygia]